MIFKIKEKKGEFNDDIQRYLRKCNVDSLNDKINKFDYHTKSYHL